jgi:hypothetical protein
LQNAADEGSFCGLRSAVSKPVKAALAMRHFL